MTAAGFSCCGFLAGGRKVGEKVMTSAFALRGVFSLLPSSPGLKASGARFLRAAGRNVGEKVRTSEEVALALVGAAAATAAAAASGTTVNMAVSDEALLLATATATPTSESESGGPSRRVAAVGGNDGKT